MNIEEALLMTYDASWVNVLAQALTRSSFPVLALRQNPGSAHHPTPKAAAQHLRAASAGQE